MALLNKFTLILILLLNVSRVEANNSAGNKVSTKKQIQIGIDLNGEVKHDCKDRCEGGVTITYTVSDNSYLPSSFTWYQGESMEIFQNGQNLVDACPGSYRLVVSFEAQAPLEQIFMVEEKDEEKPYILAEDFRMNGVDAVYNGDSLTYDVDCKVSKAEAIGYLDLIYQRLLSYARDNCDSTLQVVSGQTVEVNDYYRLFLAARSFVVSDDAGNAVELRFIFFASTVPDPVIEYVTVLGSNYYPLDNETIETIPVPKDEVVTIEVFADPVCDNNPLRIEWDENNDGNVDSNGDALTRSWDAIGSATMKVQAIGTSIRNTASNRMNINLDVQGFEMRDSIAHASCADRADGSIFIMPTYSQDYEPPYYFWTNEANQPIAYTQNLSGLRPGKYFLHVEFDSGHEPKNYEYEVLAIDTQEPKIYRDYLELTLLDTFQDNQGGVNLNYSGDTLLVGVSCLFTESSGIFFFENYNTLYAYDNCSDTELPVTYGPIITNNGDPAFLASRIYTTQDVAGNTDTLEVVIFVETLYEPVVNYLTVDGVEIPLNFDDNVVCVEKGKKVVISADVDPVCANTEIELLWDVDQNGENDYTGDLEETWNETTSITLQINRYNDILNASQTKPLRIQVERTELGFNILEACEQCNATAEVIVFRCNEDYLPVQSVSWYNLATSTLIATGERASSLCPGGYKVEVTFQNSTTLIDTLSVPSPISANVTATAETCSGQNDGAVLISAAGGSGEYEYQIKQDDEWIPASAGVDSLSPGDYIVSVTDAKYRCRQENTITVLEGISPPVASFTLDVDRLELSERNYVHITNQSTNASSYLWFFGNGDTSDTEDAEFTHTIDESGDYEIKLIAMNDISCLDSLTKVVQVVPVVGIEMLSPGDVVLYPNPSQKHVTLRLKQPVGPDLDIRIFDSIGGSSIAAKVTAIKSEHEVIINVEDLLAGVYYFNISVNGKSGFIKFLKI